MNTVRIKNQEDESKIIEVSDNDAELLICKQLFNPLTSEFSIFVLENFQERFLKNEIRQKIFKIGYNYWKKYESVPSETAMMGIFNNEKFSDKKSEYIKEYHNIVNLNEKDLNEKYVKDLIIKFTKMRHVYFTMLDQFDEIEKNGDIGDCLGRFEKIVQLDISDDLGIEYFSNLENHCNNLISIESRLEFGFSELDRYTYGGMPTNDPCLVVIMAQPGLGKSQFMMNVAYNWVMKKKNVLMISLEMSEEMYSRRFDGLFTDLNINKLKDNVGMLRLKIKQLKNQLIGTKLRIKEFPTGTCSASMIKQFLKKLRANGFVPDLICVDYLNIMRPNSSNVNMGLYEKCARISEELRAISCELKIPILTATQANRCLETSSIVIEKNKGKIKLSDVNVGDKLLSKNGIYNKVVKKYDIESSKTYKITTKSGKTIICTDIHEWPTKDGNKTIKSGLKIGDKLIKRNFFDFIKKLFKRTKI